jgi:class 3 adenylate cyclase/tetratricopeptide (TPR) repeat protein
VKEEKSDISIPQLEKQAERAISIGEPIVAFDLLVSQDEERFSAKCWQLLGQALANCGSPLRAREILEKQYLITPTPELCASLARIYKDLWAVSVDSDRRLQFVARSHGLYVEAAEKFDRAGIEHESYYSWINAASTAVFMSRSDLAEEYAEKARRLCMALLTSRSTRSRHWIEATLGEAMIILGDVRQAGVHYRRAQESEGCRNSHTGTMRKQARLALAHCGFDSGALDAEFNVPKVCVFSGHMLDGPGRETPRFQAADINRVQSEINRFFDSKRIGITYSSAACGSDILFLEEAIRRGVESIIVLPFPPEEFKRSSVSFAGPDWERRFDKVIASASNVINLDDDPSAPGAIAFTYTNRYLDGAAMLRARALATEVCCLAVWDGSPPLCAGGTSEIVTHWQQRREDLSIIGVGKPSNAVAVPENETSARTLVSVLFADVVGFSKLGEPQIVPYVENFLAGIRELSNRYEDEMTFVNTWGDAIFAVFSSVEKVGEFALALRKFIYATDWEEVGLPESLNMRIALHSAPANALFDPVLGRVNYFGQHISQAARMEPITPPGEVYASESFAALSASEGVDSYVCEYVGRVPLAKEFGTFPLFHVREDAD